MDFFFEFDGGDTDRASENDMLFAVMLTPFDGFLETLMALVGPGDENIKVYIFHNLGYIGVNNRLIDISDRPHHILAVGCGIEQSGVGLEFQHIITVLHGHYEIIS